MNFDIFDEEFYLKKYPFVESAIEQGIVQSGLDHFQRFGLQQGLTEVSRYYDETFYLAENPGVANAVNSGVFPSGLAHFIEFGYEEGRTRISSDYDEVFYVSNNSDLQPFIEQGVFRNGLEHFLNFGINESRFSNSFLEIEYLERYQNLVSFIDQGVFRTGREHYEEFGQFENRSVTFTGSPDDDILISFGIGEVELIGVEVGLDANGNRIYESDGFNETDILIGGPGSDTFVIGIGRSLSDSPPGDFYGSVGSFGKATIQNYDQQQDFLQLGGQPGDYIFGTDTTSFSTIFNRSRVPLVDIQGITDFNQLNILYTG